MLTILGIIGAFFLFCFVAFIGLMAYELNKPHSGEESKWN